MSEPLEELIRALQLTPVTSGRGAGRGATRERILDAAIACFSARGFDGVRTREIAAEAGVAEKTLFQHFGSKAELFTQALQPMVMKLSGPEALTEVLAVLIAPDASLRDKLRTLALNRVAFLAKHPTIASFIIRELLQRESLRAAFIAQVGARVSDALQAIFKVARDRGEIGPVAPERAMRLFLSALIGYALTRSLFAPGDRWDDEVEIDALLDTLFDGWRCET